MRSLAYVVAFSLVVAPAYADIDFPVSDTEHLEYFASLAFAGPRLRDCSPKLTEDPRSYDLHGYGLFLARWTGDRPLYHGTPNGDFDPSQIRLPAFFATERYYSEIHGSAHSKFPERISADGYTEKELEKYSPKLFAYSVGKSSPEPDFIYGYEFWPEKFAAALEIPVQPDAADKAGWNADNIVWAEEAAKTSGTGDFAKKAPANVVTSRWMSRRLSELLKLRLRGTIARRLFPTPAAALVAKAQLKANSDTLDVRDPSYKDLVAILTGDQDLKSLARYFDPQMTDPPPIRMGYDEVVLFDTMPAPLKYKKAANERLADDFSLILDILLRWATERCDGPAAKTVSYGLDYRAFIPFPRTDDQSSNNLRHAAAVALLPKPDEDVKGHTKAVEQALWAYSDDLLATTTAKLQLLGVKYNEKLVTRLLTDIAKSAYQSSQKPLTPNEMSSLRNNAYQILELFCSAYKSGTNSLPVKPCRGGDLDLSP